MPRRAGAVRWRIRSTKREPARGWRTEHERRNLYAKAKAAALHGRRPERGCGETHAHSRLGAPFGSCFGSLAIHWGVTSKCANQQTKTARIQKLQETT